MEIQSHGGALVVRRILELALQNGARMAEPGEFTKRAFLNGRLDLSQAQSVMDIIKARTDASLRMAAGHLQGKFSDEIKAMRHDILEVIAHLEASIDFPEVVTSSIMITRSPSCSLLPRKLPLSAPWSFSSFRSEQ